MSVKTVICALCGETVTKRSTLDLRILKGGVRGRACRSHEEVINLKQDVLKQETLERMYRETNEAVQVLMGIASVRLMHTVHAYPLEAIYARMSRALPSHVVKKIRDGVAEKGAVMNQGELMQTFLMGAHIRERIAVNEAS